MTLIPASLLAQWSAVEAGALDDHELISGLAEVVAAMNALAGLQARVVTHIEARGLAKQLGAGSTSEWLGGTGAMNPGAAKRLVRTALGLEKLPEAFSALGAGEISADHADAIVGAIAAMEQAQSDLDDDGLRSAEQVLLDVARVHSPYLVADKGRELLLRLQPEEHDNPAEDVTRNRWTSSEPALGGPRSSAMSTRSPARNSRLRCRRSASRIQRRTAPRTIARLRSVAPTGSPSCSTSIWAAVPGLQRAG